MDQVLAYKKSVAQMLSMDMQAGERKFDGESLIVQLSSLTDVMSGHEKMQSKVCANEKSYLQLEAAFIRC